MKVDRVTATIKYSQDTGHGAWRAVEVGAEGSVDAKENWQVAQASLYGQLSKQIKVLWTNGQKPQDGAQEPTEAASDPEPPETPTQPPEHYCLEHQREFKRYSRGENVWWSHKTAEGRWCREK